MRIFDLNKRGGNGTSLSCKVRFLQELFFGLISLTFRTQLDLLQQLGYQNFQQHLVRPINKVNLYKSFPINILEVVSIYKGAGGSHLSEVEPMLNYSALLIIYLQDCLRFINNGIKYHIL